MNPILHSTAWFLADQRSRWHRGDRVRVEAYLEQHRHDIDADAVIELICNEIVLREEVGETPLLAEYLQRFPEHHPPVKALFDARRTHRVERARSIGTDAALLYPTQAHPDVVRLPSLEINLTIPGYEILGELGRGGMGVVYKARQTALKRLVALKMILAGPHADAVVQARFRTEAEAIARLQHPNIVQIYNVGIHDGRPFLALEYVEGGNLESRVASKPQPEREAAQLVETIARAIHYTHEHGILHRDLKPNNILLAADGSPKITDFGLAKLRDADVGITQTHALLGTPNYMPPEQAAGNAKHIGVQADVYSLGAILYELLTGRPPFKGTTLLKTLDQVRYQEPVAPRRLRGRMSSELETICLKCLEKEPANRYASANALADDLRRFLDGQSIRAQPVPAWQRAWRWSWRHPAILAAAGAALLLVCLAWISIVHLRAQSELTRRQAEDRYQKFVSLRDEAFFHGLLSPDEGALFLGAEANANLRRAESAARHALALAGMDARAPQADWSPPFAVARQAECRADCYGLLLVLASLRGQQGGKASYEEALRILNKAAAIGQTRSLHLRRAYFLDRLGQAEQAQQARTKAAANGPEGAVDHFLDGEESYRRGDWEDARDAFNRAVTLQPTHFWARFFLAVCHLKSQRWDAAKEGLNGCIGQQPDFVWAYLFRSFANEKLQKPQDAAADFDKALRLEPKSDARYVLYLTRGILHFNQREWEGAAADFRAAQALKPDQYNAYLNLAQVHLARGEFSEANAEMARALKCRPPTEVVLTYHVERARHLLNANQPKEALAEAETAVELRIDSPAAQEMHGRALLALGRFAEAEAALDRFFTLGGKASTDTYRARGQARMKQGKYADAVDDYTRALDKQPDAEIYLHRGWAHFFADAWKLALRDFQKTIDLDPEPSDGFIGRGLARVMLGDFQAAVADADAALARKPAAPEMMHNIACIFAQAALRAKAASDEPSSVKLALEYHRRAMDAIRQTLALVPEADRASFWREKIAPDSALSPIRGDPEYQRLHAAYPAPDRK